MPDDPNNNPNPADDPQDPADPSPGDPDPARELASTKRRLAQIEAQNRKLTADLKKHDDDKLTEAEKLTQDRAAFDADKKQFEKDRQSAKVAGAVETAARKAGFHDPEDAHLHINADEVEFDGDGQPKNIPKLLTELLERKPYLAPAGGTSNPGTRRPAPVGGGNEIDAMLRRAAGRE